MKRKLSILLFTFVIGVGMVFAEKVKIGDLYYNLDDVNLTAEVTSENNTRPYWSTSISTITIPSSITYNSQNYRVTSIGSFAFFGCSGLTSITIPNSVTSIGDDAFTGCINMTSIAIPDSVTSIGSCAFADCSSLISINIPNGVVNIEPGTFARCTNMTIVTIPNSVYNIGDGAFNNCTNLPSITIPQSVTCISDLAFYNCDSLTSIIIPNNVTSIGQMAFYECNSLTSVTMLPTIPPTIGTNIFGCDYTRFYIGKIYVPCGSIETYLNAERWSAFASEIKYAPFPYVVTTKTENGVISTTSTDEYTICDEHVPVTCTAIPSKGCYFVRWSDGNTDNPRTIELMQDTTMEAIFDYLLTGKCGKDSVLTWTLDTTTMALDITGKGALSENYTYGTFIESLTIGNEITSVGYKAFSGFSNLKSVILGSSVKVLEEKAFQSSSAIETITCYSQRPPTVNNRALEGMDYSTIIYVPADYLETYQMHDAWGLYDVRPLSASSTETNEVNVTPSENAVSIVWPAVSGAATYELVIKDKNGNVICTLVFNANGQLAQIIFGAPTRDHSAQQTQSTGFAFTVTGLESGTGYDLTITSKDGNGSTLDTQTVSFTTTGEPQTINNIPAMLDGSRKLFRNGQIFIMRGDKTYTLTGKEIIVPQAKK